MDDEAAAVVRRIFAMTMEGCGPYQIACQLTDHKIEIPAVHMARHGEGVNKNKTFKDIYGWGLSTIVNILKSANTSGIQSISSPKSISRTRKAIMPMKTNGRFSRIPMRPSSTKRPLTMYSASVTMSGAIRTDGARPTPSPA